VTQTKMCLDTLLVVTKYAALQGGDGRSREATNKAFEGALERRGIEQIDIFYYHYDDENVSSDNQSAIANDLIAERKIKHLALSNYTPARLRGFFDKSAGTPARPVALQPH